MNKPAISANCANYTKFESALREQYESLFANDPEYAYVTSRMTPSELAAKMTRKLRDGGANKEGKGVKTTCKLLGVRYTYKAIAAYLSA